MGFTSERYTLAVAVADEAYRVGQPHVSHLEGAGPESVQRSQHRPSHDDHGRHSASARMMITIAPATSADMMAPLRTELICEWIAAAPQGGNNVADAQRDDGGSDGRDDHQQDKRKPTGQFFSAPLGLMLAPPTRLPGAGGHRQTN